jgi:hypothetical protein
MPIKFTCPHCKKVLNVKDTFAGKKGPCPSCKKIVAVPAQSAAVVSNPAPTPAAPTTTNGHTGAKEPPPPTLVDAEAAAAAALADEPPPEEIVPTFVDFNCPMCDEPLHLSAELAGKRAPCPECKRIIKVPELKKREKADWRNLNPGLPSGARRPDEPAPEGAWGTAAASAVSREALEEAQVIPDKYWRPLSTRDKIMRGVYIGAAVLCAVIVVVLGFSWWFSSREARSVKNVETYANSPEAKSTIKPEGVAALYAALGEYHLRAKKAGGAKEAQTYFQKAVDAVSQEDTSERDAVLADVALAQVDLGGSKEEITATTRLDWKEAQAAVGKTLRAMRNNDARLDAYRAVCRKLIARKQAERGLALAAQISDEPERITEAEAAAGLEMLSAKQDALASRAADQALTRFAQDERPALTPSVVALAEALKRSPPAPKGDAEDENTLIGQAEGLARQGQWDAGRAKAAKIENSLARMQAYVALAAAGDARADNPDLDAAVKLAPDVLKGKPAQAPLGLRLAEIAAHAGAAEQAEAVAAAIDDTALVGRARLAVLRARLAAKSGGVQPVSADPPTLSHFLSVLWIARHAKKYDGDKGNAAEYAFGTIGALLGPPSD